MAITKDAIFNTDTKHIPLPPNYPLPTPGFSQEDPLQIGSHVYSMTATNGVSTTSTLGLDALIAAFETWLAGTFIPDILGVDATKTTSLLATINSITVGNTDDDIYENDATRKFDIAFTSTLKNS